MFTHRLRRLPTIKQPGTTYILGRIVFLTINLILIFESK